MDFERATLKAESAPRSASRVPNARSGPWTQPRLRRVGSGLRGGAQFRRFDGKTGRPWSRDGTTVRPLFCRFIESFNRTFARSSKWTYAGRPLSIESKRTPRNDRPPHTLSAIFSRGV